MHKEDIKAGLRKEFGSLLAFEEEYGLPKESSSQHLRGKSSFRVAAAIADALGVEIYDLWPDRYPRPQRRSGDRQAIPKTGTTHRQIGGAR